MNKKQEENLREIILDEIKRKYGLDLRNRPKQNETGMFCFDENECQTKSEPERLSDLFDKKRKELEKEKERKEEELISKSMVIHRGNYQLITTVHTLFVDVKNNYFDEDEFSVVIVWEKYYDNKRIILNCLLDGVSIPAYQLEKEYKSLKEVFKIIKNEEE